jgi:hypothetical protein
MARPVVVSVVIAVVGSLAACAEDITAENYSAALNEANCRHLVNCGALDTVEDCHRALPMFAIPLDTGIAAAIEAGKMVFNSASARGCVEAIATDSCDVTPGVRRSPPDICAQAFGGTVHGGGTCAFDRECISQSCDVTPCGPACCTGTCVGDRRPGLPQLGEPCAQYGVCAAGLLCNGTTCGTRLPEGARCRSPYECDDGLFCRLSAIPGTCVPLSELGESCGYCRDLGAVCGSQNVCVTAALGGDTCAPERPCSPYYTCGANSRCALRAKDEAMIGELCDDNTRCVGERALCGGPNDQPAICVQILLEGEPCEPDAQDQSCWIGVCDPETHTCRGPPVCL